MLRFSILALASALAACSGRGVVPAIPPAYGSIAIPAPRAALDEPPRLQWMNNHGYCGETALLSAGLYYGQYASQYRIRAVASGNRPQYLANSQLLLGVNAEHAASAMHLRSLPWHTGRQTSSDDFLAWVKRNVAHGYPVTIGVYMNGYAFYGKKQFGYAAYDHIVPVRSIISHHPIADGRYYPDDEIVFSDNGLYGPAQYPGHFKPLGNYLYRDAFGTFQRTRVEANSAHAPVYSLPKQTTGGTTDYGIAILGVTDRNGETLPVRLTANKFYEWPPIATHSTRKPVPEAVTLTVTVSGIEARVSYNLYRYDAFGSVPDGAFNAHARSAKQRWKISIESGSTFVLRQRIASDQIAVYRAVRADAP